MFENKRDLMPYLLYYCQSRLLVENIDGHVVDIGGAELVGGKLRWQLDGKEAKGTTENEAEEMLNDVARHLSFLFVDGQFTSLPDVRGEYGDRLDNAPSREISLSELNDSDEDIVR